MNTDDEVIENKEGDNTEDEEQQTESLADVIESSIEEGVIDEETGGIDDTEEEEKEGAEKEEPKEGDKPKEEVEQNPETEDSEKKDDDEELLSPLEEGSERTKERFNKLTESYKETKAKYEQVNEQFEGLKAAITEVATPEEFGDALSYLADIKSGDPARLENALEVIEHHRQQIYKALGKEAPGIDLLTDFDDLQEKVDSLEISREDALQIAQARRLAATQQQQQQTIQQHQEVQTQTQDAIQAGIQSIAEFEQQVRAKDPAFSRKLPILESQIQQITQSYPPELWRTAIEQAYSLINQSQQSSNPGRSKQPLSGGSVRPGKPEIKNTQDALLNLFGMAD